MVLTPVGQDNNLESTGTLANTSRTGAIKDL